MAVSGRQAVWERQRPSTAGTIPSGGAAPKQGAKQLLTAQIHNLAVLDSLLLATYRAMQRHTHTTPTMLCCWCCAWSC